MTINNAIITIDWDTIEEIGTNQIVENYALSAVRNLVYAFFKVAITLLPHQKSTQKESVKP